jgi:serine protease Do
MDLAGLAAALRQVTVQVTDGRRAAGSGVVYWPACVVTNAHVARHPEVLVRAAGGEVRPGRVVARDPRLDLVLIHAPGLAGPPATLAPDDTLRVGALVVAVGHPLGMRGALTTGIVHATTALGPSGRAWIQSDLRLAPGNSGGPLADARGRVVGINAMLLGALALAIPIAEVTRFVRAAG